MTSSSSVPEGADLTRDWVAVAEPLVAMTVGLARVAECVIAHPFHEGLSHRNVVLNIIEPAAYCVDIRRRRLRQRWPSA